jgi:hypothetical protein
MPGLRRNLQLVIGLDAYVSGGPAERQVIYMKLFNAFILSIFLYLSFLHDSLHDSISLVFFHNIQNFLAVFVCTAMLNIVYKKEQLKNVAGTTVGLVIYEFIQLSIPTQTFDWFDIAASVLGLFTYLLFYFSSHAFFQAMLRLYPRFRRSI